MLPWPNGTGAADADGFILAQGTNAIGNEAIHAPITAADDVARPGGGCTDASVLCSVLREKRFQISVENDFRASFGCTVGVMSAQRIVFPVAPNPLSVIVAFVTGDVD